MRAYLGAELASGLLKSAAHAFLAFSTLIALFHPFQADMATQTSPQPAAQAVLVAHATQTFPMPAPLQPAALQLPTTLPPAQLHQAKPAAAPAPGLLVSVPVEAAVAAQVPPTILRAFSQRRPSSAPVNAALSQKPTVPPRHGLSGAATAAVCGTGAAPAMLAAVAAAHAVHPPAKPSKPTTSPRAAKAALGPLPARRLSTRLAESKLHQQQRQQQQVGAPIGTNKLGPDAAARAEGRAAGGRAGQHPSAKAAAQNAALHAGSQVGRLVALRDYGGTKPLSPWVPLFPPSQLTLLPLLGPICSLPPLFPKQHLWHPHGPVLAASANFQLSLRLPAQRLPASSSGSSRWPSGSGRRPHYLTASPLLPDSHPAGGLAASDEQRHRARQRGTFHLPVRPRRCSIPSLEGQRLESQLPGRMTWRQPCSAS